MKKLFLLAFVMVTSLVCMAQQPTDSISVMFKHLQDTNTEFARVNDNLKTHAAMVGVGGAAELFGFLMMYSASADVDDTSKKKYDTGLAFCIGGAALVAASFIPLARKGVQLDGRGLVVHPSELKKK